MCEPEMLSIAAAAELIRSRKISPVELTKACLGRIENIDPEVNAFITVTAELAMEQAREAEREIKAGQWRGRLHGIPIALKDLIDTAGVRTTAASAVFENRVPEEDAEVVRLLRQGGAVIVGKTNLHEFAYGGSSVISHWGAVRNPRNPAHIAGGSSGGSAAAVAAGMCLAALGTDTAGSIREPASFCGVVGLKPTYGLVSARGVVPLAWSYDHVGPITRTVEDAAIMLQAIAGYDEADIFSRRIAVSDYASEVNRKTPQLRVGIAREYFVEKLDCEVSQAVDAALEKIASIAESVREVKVLFEPDRAAANCESWVFHKELVAGHASLYQASTLERLRAGESIGAAEYISAVHRLERMRREAASLFRDVDVIVTPTVPVLPPTLDELQADLPALRKREVVMLRNTRPFNVLGVPAITIPCARAEHNLSVGLQIAGAPGADPTVLRAARMIADSL